jgi:predicted transcriptional regulator
MDASAESMHDLAGCLDRDIRQVHDDLETLSEYHIVHFHEEGGAKNPFVPYDTVQIEVELGTSLGDASGSAST